ncbi:MAG TPA: M13 family metallopeptidase [Allosphingosinicella sp.]|jgi:putative endopeptidase
MKTIHLLAVSLAALSAGTASPPVNAADAPTRAAAQHKVGAWGIDLSARDTSVRPGDSLFNHANGGWLKRAEIPADQPLTGVALDLYLRTQDQLRAVIEDSARNPSTQTARQVGGLYASFLDEAAVEKRGAAPLLADLAEVKAVRSKAEMAELMGKTHGIFGSSFFSFGVGPDAKGKNVYTSGIGISGIGLPDRDYYLADQFKPQRDAYSAHVARTLAFAGWPDPEGAAGAVLALETRIAEASWPRTDQRDPNRMYHPMSPAELRAHAPGFDWNAFFRGLGDPKVQEIVVSQDTAVPKVAQIFAEAPLDTLRAWQAFHITDQASPYLPRRFVENRFAFTRALTGQQQQRPRWLRGVQLVDASLGEALGKEYVARHFPASSKAEVTAIVRNLHAAMKARIEAAEWMSPETKAAALAKLARQRVKVGYPDKWRDYSALKIDPADLYGNVKRAGAFQTRYYFGRLGQTVDKAEWLMTPQTVNAYFNPVGNEIVFPAAMLQAPVFDPGADAAVNYGAVGSVIGHEITHGFDDQGRQFDEAGRLRDWWKPEDAARFSAEAARLAAQYDGYEGAPGMKVNGKLTLGENIGDQGGVRIALDAYHASLGGKPAPVLDGLTGDQRFFLSWAQNWRNKMREEMTRMILVSDPHSPFRWRVDGTLRNIDEFYTAFAVKPGEKLYLAPEQRVRVW